MKLSSVMVVLLEMIHMLVDPCCNANPMRSKVVGVRCAVNF